MGLLLLNARDEVDEAREKLNHVFRVEASWMVCDYIPMLYAMSLSSRPGILKELRSKVLERRRGAGIGDLREVFDDLLTRIDRRIVPEFRFPGGAEEVRIGRGERRFQEDLGVAATPK
jgi:hypothetical protein